MTDSGGNPLQVEPKDGVLTLTLHRPKVLNALNAELTAVLLAALQTAEKDSSVRVAVITGAGKAFCAGIGAETWKEHRAKPLSLGDELRRRYNPLVRQIRRMEKPVVASVNGVCAGIGMSVALACDIKICSVTAKFIPSFIRLGLAPDAGLSHRLVRGMGRSLACEHLWTAKHITARQAEHFGMVNQVVPSDELARTTRELAAKLAKAAPKAVALIKRMINRAQENDFDSQLDYEAQLQDTLGKSRDHREGLEAFLASREPKFTGE